MKVVNREDFLDLPDGTIFCAGRRWSFGEIMVRGDVRQDRIDFTSRQICWINECPAFEAFEDMLENGASYPMETGYGRDAQYNEDELYLVFEKADLVELIGELAQAYVVSPT